MISRHVVTTPFTTSIMSNGLVDGRILDGRARESFMTAKFAPRSPIRKDGLKWKLGKGVMVM